MTAPEGYRLTSIDHTRASDALDLAEFAFAFSVPERDRNFVDGIVNWSRGRIVEVADDARGTPGAPAGFHTSYEFQMRVPGGRELATAGLSWVVVHPAHRRRGILSAMIADHFERSLARGEAVSTLYAAEPKIYQRFGYGLAAYDVAMDLSRGADFRDIPGVDALTADIETADAARHGPIIAAIQAQMMRPGTVTQFAQATIADMFVDLEIDRLRWGAEARRFIVVRDAGAPVAWALWHRTQDWGQGGPEGKVQLHAWGSLSAAASLRLWKVLSDLDLMALTQVKFVAADDPLIHLLQDMRAQKMRVNDNLWLRVLDVPGALEARGYAADCDVTVAVTDKQVGANEGVWRIRVSGGEAAVSRADALAPEDADLALGIQELGTAYLGGVTVNELWRAGLISQRTEGAAQALSNAMVADMKPMSNFGF